MDSIPEKYLDIHGRIKINFIPPGLLYPLWENPYAIGLLALMKDADAGDLFFPFRENNEGFLLKSLSHVYSDIEVENIRVKDMFSFEIPEGKNEALEA